MAKTLSAGYSFLGKLANDLSGLSGLDTLVYELIQNADDAADATEMVFDVSKNRLTVWNDGVFTDCGDQDSKECPGVSHQDGSRVRCDFHSFRLISGQAKRDKVGTTGAFGIGFTSVFQVCDYPELVSAGRHWILRYDEAEDDRIHVCDGCHRDGADGTEIVLPWALDGKTRVRRELRTGAVGADVADRFVAEFRASVPGAMVFLRRLRKIELRRNGRVSVTFSRSEAAPWRFVESGSSTQSTLYVLEGDFNHAAATLGAAHPDVFDTREPTVALAIPTEEPPAALPLHAILPTLELVPLQFRLSSSFYPFQDRKRIKFEADDDSESAWNRAAVRAAAEVLAANLESLGSDLGPRRLWSLLAAAHAIASGKQDAPDEVFKAFWDEIVNAAIDAPIVWTTQEAWIVPTDAYLPRNGWGASFSALAEVGLHVVHPDIHQLVAPSAEELGIRELKAPELAEALQEHGFTSTVAASSLPGCLAEPAELNALLRVVADLAVAEPRDTHDRIVAFDGCAVFPCLDGSVTTPGEMSAEDDSVVDLFGSLPGLRFADLARLDRIDRGLRELLWPLHASEVIEALEEAQHDGREFSDLDVPAVLSWLADQAEDLDDDDVERLRALSIFPTATGLLPLTELELPGPFTSDPLGISKTVDLSGIETLRSFFSELGTQTLSLEVYIHQKLVPAFETGAKFDPDAIDKLLAVFLERIDDLDDGAVEALGELPLVPTAKGRMPPVEAYFGNDLVTSLFGGARVVSATPKWLRRMKSLLETLGVSDHPRPEDIVSTIEALVARPKTGPRVRTVRTIVEHLGPQFRFTARERDEREAALRRDYEELLELAWLPVADDDRWARPCDLYRTDWRTAFATTGSFIDLPEKTVQQPNADFLELLGVQMRPEPRLVVQHLLGSAARGQRVARRVYEALNGADEPELEDLVNTDCILISNNPVVYMQPSRVVGDPGPLREYLKALPRQLADFKELLGALGISETVTARHAINILASAAGEFEGVPLPSSRLAAIQHCWLILEREREDIVQVGERQELDEFDELVHTELGDASCWPDRSGVLREPGGVLIDDMPALRRYMPDAVLELLVDRPRHGVAAPRAAGLRTLSEALDEEVVTVRGAAPHVLSTLLRHRHDPLARIVAADDLDPAALKELPALEIFGVDEVVVRREITDPPIDLGEHEARVLLDNASGRLYIRAGDPPPWTEIAVAVARLLNPISFSSGLATNIEKVLTASSISEAHQTLDLLNVPRLETEFEAAAEDTEAEPLFGDEPELDADDTEPEHDEFAADPEESDAEPQEPHGEADEPAGEAHGEVEDEIESQPDHPAGESTGESHVGEGDVPPPEASPPPADKRAPGSNVPRGVTRVGRPGAKHDHEEAPAPWRMWVSGTKGANQESQAEHPATAQLRGQIAKRGVELVLRYEQEHGRLAEEMPPNNPGYDVESRTAPGRPVARFIEVKSLAGTWEAEWARAGRPPQLTSEQFRLSTTEGKHWVYVVERALEDDWCIYPIQAVGQRANRYLLDHGWKEAADRPWGAGFDPAHEAEAEAASLPPTKSAVFGRDESADGDVPFLEWPQLHLVGSSDLNGSWPAWFTSPETVNDGDFAIQQRDRAMGPTLPFGAIAVFRPISGDVSDQDVVLADVSPSDDERMHVIRRVRTIRDDTGRLEGIELVSDIPGAAEDFEFMDEYATGRVLARLVAFQEM